jgi:FtsP/CotA-like multicopper oxidase with cupredoxin domain
MALRDNEKPTLLTRRQILATGVTMAGTIPFLPTTRATAAPEPRTAKFRLTAGTRTLAVHGKSARVFGLTGPNGNPGITLSPGERFDVDLTNQAGTSTIVHWHGQLPPWKQDGFPWPQTPPIPAGDTHSYDYVPIAGTYWMHSHQGMQEQSLMTAPLIVRSAEDMRADRQEVVLMLHDFSFRTPEELLAGLTKSSGGESAMPKSGMDSAMNMGSGAMGAMNMGSGMAMDLNDIDYDAFLANDRTFADPEVIRTEPGGRVRLRLINGASATQFWVDLGALGGTVVAVDVDRCAAPVSRSPWPSGSTCWLIFLGTVPIQSSRRSRASGPAQESFSQHPARLCHASPRRPKKMRHRSIYRLNIALKRSRPWRRARPT